MILQCVTLSISHTHTHKSKSQKQVLCNIVVVSKHYKRCQFSQLDFLFILSTELQKLFFSMTQENYLQMHAFVTFVHTYTHTKCVHKLQEHQLQCQNHSSTHEIPRKCVYHQFLFFSYSKFYYVGFLHCHHECLHHHKKWNCKSFL